MKSESIKAFLVHQSLTSIIRLEALAAQGKFTLASQYVRYLRNLRLQHPIFSFTSTKEDPIRTYNALGEAQYTGAYVCGMRHGKGTLISNAGSKYEGDFIQNVRHGHGKLTYPNDDIYNGPWKAGLRDGEDGEFIEHGTGNRYVGGWQEDRRWGAGTTYWKVAEEEKDLCHICYGAATDSDGDGENSTGEARTDPSGGINALFYPCGHVCACVMCAKQVSECPICRRKIRDVVRIWKI